MKTLNLALALFFASLFCISGSVHASGKKGHKLFNLELTDVKSKDVEIKDFTGKTHLTVITFFAEYCAACGRELDSINKQYTKWQNNDVNFVAVCVSSQKDINKMLYKAHSHGWSFNMLVDDRNEAVNQLRISSIPYTIVVDQDGYIIYQHGGYSQDNLEHINEMIFGNITSNSVSMARK